MISELSQILITIISTATGTGGLAGIGLWYYNKKLKALEVQLAEANVNKARVEGHTDEFRLYKEQLEIANKRIVEMFRLSEEDSLRSQKNINDWKERYDSQTERLREQQDLLLEAKGKAKEYLRRIAKLEQRIAYLLTWRCHRNDCDHGIPPRGHLLHHKFDDSEIEDSDIMPVVPDDEMGPVTVESATGSIQLIKKNPGHGQ